MSLSKFKWNEKSDVSFGLLEIFEVNYRMRYCTRDLKYFRFFFFFFFCERRHEDIYYKQMTEKECTFLARGQLRATRKMGVWE